MKLVELITLMDAYRTLHRLAEGSFVAKPEAIDAVLYRSMVHLAGYGYVSMTIAERGYGYQYEITKLGRQRLADLEALELDTMADEERD